MPNWLKQTKKSEGPRCLLLLADGARPAAFRELFARGDLPAIQRYLASVSGERQALTAFPSVTGPTFAPLLTGVLPGPCNLPGVRWFDRHLPRSARYRPQRFRSYFGKGVYMMDHDLSPDVTTLFEQIPRSYNILGPLNRGTGLLRDFGFFWGPLLYLKSRQKGGIQAVEKKGIQFLMKAIERDPRFLFYYFPSIDALSHRYGIDHPEVTAAYRRLDAVVETIVGLLLLNGLWEETLLVLTSDHGMSDVTGYFDLDRFLEEAGLNVRYPPKGFAGWERSDVISMPSGNAMSNLYFRAESGWERFTFWEEIEEKQGGLLEQLLARPEVLLLAGRSLGGGVIVRTKDGMAHLRSAGGTFDPEGRATYEVVGGDPFGLERFPSVFDRHISIEQTSEGLFPDAPFQLLQFFAAPRAGDLLVAAAPGFELRNRDFENPPHLATHGSFFPEHMEVPLFASDPLPEGSLRSVDLYGVIGRHLGLETIPRPGKRGGA